MSKNVEWERQETRLFATGHSIKQKGGFPMTETIEVNRNDFYQMCAELVTNQILSGIKIKYKSCAISD